MQLLIAKITIDRVEKFAKLSSVKLISLLIRQTYSPSKLLSFTVCHLSKKIKYSTSWPYLISEFLVIYNHCCF